MRNDRIIAVLKEKKLALILLAGALGVLLLFSSETGFSSSKKADAAEPFDAEAYAASAEKRLCALVREIRGAGDARVMITLESAGENRLAEDRESRASTGERSEERSDEAKIAASSDGGIVTVRREPEIRGVAVVCEGAGSDAVRREVTETVRAALGVSRDKIYVAQMKKNGG